MTNEAVTPLPKDVGAVPLPLVSEDLGNESEKLFEESRRLKITTKRLLENAKRAVGIAIEENETAEIGFLSDSDGT